MDWAGKKPEIVDPLSGEVRPVELFVACLGASSYTYAEATLTQKLPEWIGAHTRMLEFFCAVRAIVVPDNTRTGVTRACRYEPDLNPTYQDFADYFDDGDGGDTVFGNVFVRCGEPGRGSFGTVFSHGGHGNRAENNIFVDCMRALGSAPWDDARWRDALKGGQDCFFPQKLLQEVDITKPPYTTHYPELVGYMDPPAGATRVNHARLNLLVRCGEVSGGNWRLEPDANWSTNDDPGFVAGPRGDYRLRRDALVFKHLSGFKPLPFQKMGLQRQRGRARL